jgi:hypothetical protein
VRWVGKSAIAVLADVKGGVRPSGLRQILYRGRDLRIAFDQKNVSGLKAGQKPIRRSGRRRRVDMPLAAQIACESPANLLQYVAQQIPLSIWQNAFLQYGIRSCGMLCYVQSKLCWPLTLLDWQFFAHVAGANVDHQGYRSLTERSADMW